MESTKHVLIVIGVFGVGSLFGGVALTAGPIWRAGAIGFFLGVVSILAAGLWMGRKGEASEPEEGEG